MEKDDEMTLETDGSEELPRDEAENALGKAKTTKGGSPDVSYDDVEETSRVAKQKTEIEKLRAEKQEYLDGWQRAKADYVNALKRFEEEKKRAIELGKVLSVTAFLPVMDSLTRAEAAGDLPDSFKGIAKQLHEAAKMLGLTMFGATGDVFDPALHEALGQDEALENIAEDRVTLVLECGWKSGEMIIRPAKVRVATRA